MTGKLVCAVAPEELSELASRVEQMIDPSTDSVHLLPTLRGALVAAGGPGPGRRAPDKSYWVAL